MSIVIRGGTVVTADRTFKADVLIEGETIVAVGEGLSGDETIDASGTYVMPGGIDPHTHMEMPFMGTHSADDFDTGTAAGRMVVNVMSALAEYERQLLIERTNEGLAHARAQGRNGGRRRVLTDQQVTAIEASAGTVSNADLAAMHGVSVRTISRVRAGTYSQREKS